MSWGYFLDLNLTIPTADWTRLAATKTGDHPIPPTWWNFREPELGEMFTAADFDAMTIGEVVALFRREESICELSTDGDVTTIRLCQHIDRGGDPGIAKPIAALVDAARPTAHGKLRLVNDGSYSGEDGVEIEAMNGTLVRKALAESWKISSKLGAEIYGGEIGEDGESEGGAGDEGGEAPPQPDEGDEGDEAAATPVAKPAAKQAAAKPAAAAKTPAPKKAAAAKQPAAKKAAAKKPVAKKAAAKPAAKKAAAKPAAKKAAAKPAAKKAAAKPAAKKAATKKPAKKR